MSIVLDRFPVAVAVPVVWIGLERHEETRDHECFTEKHNHVAHRSDLVDFRSASRSSHHGIRHQASQAEHLVVLSGVAQGYCGVEAGVNANAISTAVFDFDPASPLPMVCRSSIYLHRDHQHQVLGDVEICVCVRLCVCHVPKATNFNNCCVAQVLTGIRSPLATMPARL